MSEINKSDALRNKRFIGSKPRDSDDNRNEFQRDYGRLVHSPSFRRLQGKSQVFGAGSGDYYRTRLTHTLEVAQIARQIAYRLSTSNSYEIQDNPGLKIDPIVVECAALAHDLGHPPFGHKGEHDLNEFLKKNSSNEFYEGNAQNFRIIMHLEERYGKFSGLDLTHAVLLGINKYPYHINDSNKGKGLYTLEWKKINEIREEWGIPNGKATLEAQLMDISDDIAYSTHDIEDGMKAKKIRVTNEFLRETDWLKVSLIREVNNVKEKDPGLWKGITIEDEINKVMEEYIKVWNEKLDECNKNESIARQELKGHYVNIFANRVGVIKEDNWYKISLVKENNPHEEDSELWRFMIILKKLAWVTLVEDLRVQRLQKRGERIIVGLLDVFSNKEDALKIMPREWILKWDKMKNFDISWERFVIDYISGMTDAYADNLYGELFGSRIGNIYGE
ncbi:deoxyguanosinetriphosphate triphosphohydrolase family protein [Lysinibacillus fusiformis]|uniref:deoxyguanosinetriphosphate triphosphohydrolase family protein n=1 Tax=Lysinibacillus fusiformis TaxID=28031 RepID=UPI000886694B|nr:dNTP triphosphohydrolase [Lysinibacillus fusiformis]SCX63438.1 dGTPase [Lysinibacillus fusiformis]SDB46269.1 dGTPase [Lysinibacillus fusiformis]SFI73093.1 dGTPase [Lysinibacillus fusiformis]SFT15770.1 dGTPase [Lysinibacillus fusiformis]